MVSSKCFSHASTIAAAVVQWLRRWTFPSNPEFQSRRPVMGKS